MPKVRFNSSKVVAFNVTLDEFERLKAEFAAGGAHSLVDLARAKVMRAVSGNSLVSVAQRLDQLEQAVQQLSEAIRTTRIETSGASHGR